MSRNEFDYSHKADKLETEVYLMDVGIGSLSHVNKMLIAYMYSKESDKDYNAYMYQLALESYLYWQKQIEDFSNLRKHKHDINHRP